MNKKFLLLKVILPLIVIFVVAQLLMRSQTFQTTAPQNINVSRVSFIGATIVYFNDKFYGLSYQVVDKLRSYEAHVAFKYAITQNISDSLSLIIVFDGEWLEARVNDSNLHTLLRDTALKGAKLVSIGGETSKFFEALDAAEVYEIPITETGEVRNPAYYNPPLVGFRMKEGNGCAYPSILISDTDNVETLIRALAGW